MFCRCQKRPPYGLLWEVDKLGPNGIVSDVSVFGVSAWKTVLSLLLFQDRYILSNLVMVCRQEDKAADMEECMRFTGQCACAFPDKTDALCFRYVPKCIVARAPKVHA